MRHVILYTQFDTMYALVDCNNFYCSCERVFNPKLEGRPVIVLSNNDGCAISRSDEAKALGIAMAAPAFIMSKLLDQHKVAVFSSNYTLYGDMSRRVMDSLGSFAPKMELYSIDEAFLDLGEMRKTDLRQLGSDIRKTIKKNLGMPVSVGIASTKTLAKMANRHAKKHYRQAPVFWAANPELVREMLSATAVEDIWGIGHQYALFLSRAGFKTAADFVQAPDEWVRKNLSVVGHRLLFELRGIPSIAWEAEKPIRQNICTSRSFGNRISDKNRIAEAMANYAASCAAKLRADKTCCRSLQVFIQTNPHKTDEAQYLRSVDIDLDRASNHSGEIIKAALRGLDLIFKPGFLYMKCGVTVTDLVPESAVQGSFFDSADRERNGHVMRTIDQINQSLGKEIVRTAVQGFERPYRLKTGYLSSRYTTRMSEVLRIRN
jgi:DNA polymerase V